MKTTHNKLIKILSLAASLMITANASASDKYPLANENKVKANFSVMLDSSTNLTLGDNKAEASSKSYYQAVTGAELQKGFDIYTSGKGAVVRLTPLANNKTQSQSHLIDPNQLIIASASGEVKANSESMALVADSSTLKQSFPELFESTAAFKMSNEMGAGTFTLKSVQGLDANSEYMINVLDKNSPHSLQVESKTHSYQFNEKLSLKSRITALTGPLSSKASAELIAPDGRRWPLSIQQQGNELKIESNIDMDTERHPGKLWKVVVDLSAKHNQTLIKRTAELAIDIHSQTAKMKRFKVSSNGARLEIDVLRSGRYEARAWLYALDANQQWQPAMLLYGADWFEPGMGQLQLPFDTAKLVAAGLSGKLKVGQVQLLDQSRLSVLSTKVGNWRVSKETSLSAR
jgi:hypothetical protein